jgi:NAD(P)-dependent dehydrogenase (short-subunit alcohol dehydrogenase family)
MSAQAAASVALFTAAGGVRVPMRRCGGTQDVAEPVTYLASGMSSHITGQNIRIDCGLTCSV